MTGNLKTAFDGIRAEDTLKTNTVLFLHNKMKRSHKAQNLSTFRRYAVTFTAIAVIILSGVFAYNLYFTPSAYVDVDVNPSIGLTLNRFNRVIDVHTYNEDGEKVLTGLSLKHKVYDDALIILIDTIDQMGYIQNNGLVSVTLQSDSAEAELLTHIQTGVESYITAHHHGTQIDVFSVSSDTRNQAYERGVTPAKYLAIQELIEVDPTVTVEECRDHSIIEIRHQMRENSNHHGNGNSGDADASIDVEEGCGDARQSIPEDENTQDSVRGNHHHGTNNGKGHHGNRQD